MEELNEYKRYHDIRSVDTVLLGYMAKYDLRRNSVRPDGYTVDLEMDVLDYKNIRHWDEYGWEDK